MPLPQLISLPPLQHCKVSSDLRSNAASLVAEITAKLPRELQTSRDAPLADQLDLLLSEARALVLARATEVR